MTDPNTDEKLVRTWEPMNLPDRDGDGDRPDVDPFGFFGPGTGDGPDL